MLYTFYDDQFMIGTYAAVLGSEINEGNCDEVYNSWLSTWTEIYGAPDSSDEKWISETLTRDKSDCYYILKGCLALETIWSFDDGSQIRLICTAEHGKISTELKYLSPLAAAAFD